MRAKRLDIQGWATLPKDELLVAVEDKGQKAADEAEFDGAAKGKASRSKGKSATATRSKGKTASPRKSAPAKSASRKSATTAAAKGTAKRPTAAGKATPTSTRKRTTATPTATRKTATAKATSTRASKRAQANGRTGSYRAPLSDSIDWTKESAVGQTGKRKRVLDALREYEGDKRQAFKKLRRYATTFYPAKAADDAERMLVWLIARVAYDFAVNTGQHEQGTREAYGKSDNPANVARREARAQANGSSRKRAGARTAARKATQAKTATAKSKSASSKAKAASTRKRGAAKRGLAGSR
jgi:hypothetical protein